MVNNNNIYPCLTPKGECEMLHGLLFLGAVVALLLVLPVQGV